MRITNFLSQVGKLLKSRSRRGSVGARRAHIEFRDVSDEELVSLGEAIQRASETMRYLEWFQVNASTRRVVFAYAENAYGFDDLCEVVELAEQQARLQRAGFNEGYAHPADVELSLQRAVELAADVISFAAGVGLSVSPIPAVPFSGNWVAVLSLVRGSPRLRHGIERRLGVERADFVLNLTTSVLQTMAQRPLSALVDSAYKYSVLREIQATRQVWASREAELCAPDGSMGYVGHGRKLARPCPLPSGPIEEYADRAWVVSLSGFALSFVATRSIQRAIAALFGGLPRPARVGREVFAAEVARSLAARGILTLRADALRMLDRIDCLVLQGDLVPKEQFVISGVLAEDPEGVDDARQRARTMFDPEHPLREREDGLWVLRPWGKSDASSDIRLQEHATRRQREGALLLSLERAARVVAVVEVDIIARTGVEELIAAAQEAQMRVVVALADESVLDRFHADDVISQSEGLRAGIRRLQRDGHAVAMLGTGPSEGFAVCDLGIGLCRDGESTPWGAELICREDLADVQYIIRACEMARRVSKQAVKIALGAATFGALVSAGGLLPLTTRRVLFVVNVASLTSMANGYRTALKLHALRLPAPRDPTPWHALNPQGVLVRLGSSAEGLSRGEVVRRVLIPIAPPNDWQHLSEAVSDELFNPLAPLLAAGAGLSAVVGSTADASMVAGVVLLNALVGGVQRVRTERKIRDLARLERRRARVRRSGVELLVDAAELVVGDIVVLNPGDVVPADCRVLLAQSLEVDASSLTGESLPVRKRVRASFEPHIADRESMLYEGTSIASGRAEGIVVAVGEATEARRGGLGARRARHAGGVERRLRELMDLTGPVALAAGVGVVGGGLLRGRRMEELVGSGVSLAVASVPEGLPLLATAAQLSAAQRLSAKHALVRNGRSIEALGRVDVICLDKTGTITLGRIELCLVSDGEVHEGVGGIRRTRRNILAAALRASPAPKLFPEHDPTDEAIYRAAHQAALNTDFECFNWQRASELSFESGRSYHATLGEFELASERDAAETPPSSAPRRRLISIKGAPEAVMPLCTSWLRQGEETLLSDDARFSLAAEVTRMGRRGLRVLAVAEKVWCEPPPEQLKPADLHEMRLLGFLAFTDPVRPTARAAITGLQQAGVHTVMLTGDHPSTAEAVAAELGLLDEHELLSGAQLADLDDAELDSRITRVSVLARVTPAQKVRVIRAMQRAGRVVAMVGDGANDAPAIRLADVGVAIGEQCTAAARGAADIVLTDGRVETLVEAIKEGRAMWASVRDAVSILIGGNLGEIGFTTLVGMLSGRPPLNARQLLLVNLLTDVAPAMAIALRPPSQSTLANLANEGPDITMGQPLNREIALRAGLTSLGAGAAWGVARLTGGRTRASSVALAALVGTQLGQTIRSGQGSRTVLATGFGSAAVLAAVIQTPGLSHFFGCKPLGPIGWATAFGASFAATNLPVLVSALREWLEELEGAPDSDDGTPRLLRAARTLLLEPAKPEVTEPVSVSQLSTQGSDGDDPSN